MQKSSSVVQYLVIKSEQKLLVLQTVSLLHGLQTIKNIKSISWKMNLWKNWGEWNYQKYFVASPQISWCDCCMPIMSDTINVKVIQQLTVYWQIHVLYLFSIFIYWPIRWQDGHAASRPNQKFSLMGGPSGKTVISKLWF